MLGILDAPMNAESRIFTAALRLSHGLGPTFRMVVNAVLATHLSADF